MHKKLGFWMSILFLVLALGSAVLYLYTKNKKVYPNDLIDKVSKNFKTDLKQFLYTADESVSILKKDARSIDIDDLPVDSLNRYFSKFIAADSYLQGVVIFGGTMNYVMYKDENSWVTTHNMLTDSIVKWTRFDTKLKETGTWLDTYNFFMAQKELDVLKVGNLQPGEFVWRTAQGQQQTPQNRDLFFTIFLLKNDSTYDHAALMYRTTELEKRFASVLNFDNPLVTILTARDHAVTPIRTDDTVKIKKFDQVLPGVNKSFTEWEKTQPDSAATMSFMALNSDYWIGLDSINPILGARAYGVTISETDLVASREKFTETYLYLAIIFFLFALAAFLPVYRKRQNRESQAVEEIKPMQINELVELIKKGETSFVEFKSSLRWDFREEKPNKALEEVILKSIAAFANARGGKLFIGVTDELEIIGLEHDFKTLKKQDADYFELHLRKLINNQFGIHFANKHLHVQFSEYKEKLFCVVYILPGNKPLYLKTRNKQGQEVEKFYVRSGNSSQEIISLKEIQDYVSTHFQQK